MDKKKALSAAIHCTKENAWFQLSPPSDTWSFSSAISKERKQNKRKLQNETNYQVL